MAIKLEAQLDNSAVLQSLKTITEGFLNLSQEGNLGKLLKFDDQLVKAQFEVIRLNLEKSLSGDNLDVKTLGFDKLITYLSNIIKNSAKLTGEEFSNAAVIPIQEGLAAIDKALNDKESRLSEIYAAQKDLSQESVKRSTKEQTGFSGRVMAGSEAEAVELLKQLKEAEKEDPGSNEKRTKLIQFYEAYTKNLSEAKDKVEKLKKEEANLQKQKTGLGSEKQKLELKLKQESAKIDKDTPKFLVQILQLTGEVRKLQESLRNLQKENNKGKKESIDLTNKNLDNDKKEIDNLGQKTIKAFEYYTVMNMLKNVYRQSIKTITELDKAMTEVAIVTSLNREEAWKLIGTYQKLASETGLRVSELSGVVTQFLRQGRSLNEALELTRVAAMSAKVAGISASDAVTYLTSAVNGFGLAADQAEEIADKFAAIASKSASSFQELAIAMSKVAPVAKSAGVGVDFMMGVLAKGLETTREAPENIGTAFKTIFARMREVTDIGKATEDGMSLNRVEKALKSIGVPLREASGQFRSLENVLIDVGNQWDNLTTIEQAYIATALAGTRQQPRLLAIFNDFERTKELIQISADAVGDLTFQHLEYMTGMEAAMTQLKNSWETFITSIANADVIIGVVNFITDAIKMLTETVKFFANNATISFLVLGAISLKLLFMGAKFIYATGTAIGLSLGLIKVTATAGAAAPAVGLLTAASTKLALAVNAAIWPLTLIAIALGVVIGLAYMWYKRASIAAQGATYFSKQITKLNSNLAELEGKKNSLTKLIEDFEKLNGITNKTIENIEELNKLGDELSNVTYTPKTGEFKGKEQTFDLITTDFAGNRVVNEAELNRYLQLIENDRIAAENSIRESFTNSLKTVGIEKTFDNQVLSDYAKSVGYKAAISFIDGIADASEDSKKRAKKALEDALRVLDVSKFAKTTYTVSGFFGIGGKTFDTFQEALNYQQSLGAGAGLVSITENTIFDEEQLKEFTKNISKIYANFYQDLQNTTLEIDSTSADGMIAILETSLLLYKEAMSEARRQFTGEELELALEVIGASLNDYKIIDALINDKKFKIELIADLAIQGLSFEEIEKFLERFTMESFEKKFISKIPMSIGALDLNLAEAIKQEMKEAYDSIIENLSLAISGQSGSIREGIVGFAQSLREAGGYTEAEIRTEVIRLSNIIKTISATELAEILNSQKKVAESLFNLASDMAKGDFSNFARLAEEYGLDIVQAFMSGQEGAAEAFFEEQARRTVADINLAIEEILAVGEALGGLTESQENELATLQYMRDYYVEIAELTLMRNYRLGEGKALLENVNKILKIQNSLLDAGLSPDSPFIGFLKELNAEFTRIANQTVSDQLIADLERLKSLGVQTGDTFIFDVDNLDAGELRTAIENYLGTLEQYIEMQQQAFNEYKKTIEETYKVEINAIKNAVDEKWKQIDYANKLAEAEEKVLIGRKNLAALQISGAGSSALRQAEKELKKLEEERRRMIEEQMAAEAQKQLEAERDALILAKQQEMIDAISIYTDSFNFALAQLKELGDAVTTSTGRTFVLQERMDANTDAILDGIQATQANTEAIIALSEVMQEQATNPVTGVARGSGFVDSGIFLGIS
jgi:TP901 family phage tail tape measure protein